jgi:hypothetical protein
MLRDGLLNDCQSLRNRYEITSLRGIFLNGLSPRGERWPKAGVRGLSPDLFLNGLRKETEMESGVDLTAKVRNILDDLAQELSEPMGETEHQTEIFLYIKTTNPHHQHRFIMGDASGSGEGTFTNAIDESINSALCARDIVDPDDPSGETSVEHRDQLDALRGEEMAAEVEGGSK